MLINDIKFVPNK